MAQDKGGKPGLLLAVVGPSGAGKDTLIEAAARAFADKPGLTIARRIITRPAEAGGEDHQSVTDEEFEALRAGGAFACYWQAHGLSYGIPVSAREAVARGELVIANGSRSALRYFKAAFPHLKVLNITARPDVLAERLAARGRESRADILARLERSNITVAGDFDVVMLDNSGTLEDGQNRMIAFIGNLLG